MTKKLLGSVLLAATLGFAAHAEILTLTYPSSGGTNIDGVPVSASGVLTVDGRTSNLTTELSGLRSKSIAFLTAKVYVAQILMASPASYVKSCSSGQPTADEASLNSLNSQSAVAIRLDYVYNVSVAQATSALQGSFAANGVSMSDPVVTALMNAVSNGGGINSGSHWVISLERLSASEVVMNFEDANGNVTSATGSAATMTNIMSLFMGKPAAGDSGLATFINQMMCGN